MARPIIECTEQHIKQVTKLMSEGFLDYQLAAKWDISESTLKRWKNNNIDFKEAYDIGLPKCEAWWADWGQKGMQGLIKGFHFPTWQSFMQTKFKWTPKNEQPQITIGNMNVLQAKNNDELFEILNRKLSKLSNYTEIKVLDVNQE